MFALRSAHLSARHGVFGKAVVRSTQSVKARRIVCWAVCRAWHEYMRVHVYMPCHHARRSQKTSRAHACQAESCAGRSTLAARVSRRCTHCHDRCVVMHSELTASEIMTLWSFNTRATVLPQREGTESVQPLAGVPFTEPRQRSKHAADAPFQLLTSFQNLFVAL